MGHSYPKSINIKDGLAYMTVGCGNAIDAKMSTSGRLFTMSDNGYLWETDLEQRFTAGTIHYSQKYRLDGFKRAQTAYIAYAATKCFVIIWATHGVL